MSSPPPSTTARQRHAAAAGAFAVAGGLWLLHYPLRPPCPDNFVHFDLGIPVAIAGLCLVVGVWQAARTALPSRHGRAALALAVLALLPLSAALVLLHADVTGQPRDCWTF